MRTLLWAMAVLWCLSTGCRRGSPADEPPYVIYPPIASDRDGLGTLLGDACLRLRSLGCPEGDRIQVTPERDETCFELLTELERTHQIPASCVRASDSREAIRACGSDATLRFECQGRP